MLKILQQKIEKEAISKSRITIIRGDVEVLPLLDNSLDAIYAGAAMHCWDNTEEAMKNIYQVLRKGGKLFATTFVRPLPSIVFRFFSVEELYNLVREAGFSQDKVQIETRGIYSIIKCLK